VRLCSLSDCRLWCSYTRAYSMFDDSIRANMGHGYLTPRSQVSSVGFLYSENKTWKSISFLHEMTVKLQLLLYTELTNKKYCSYRVIPTHWEHQNMPFSSVHLVTSKATHPVRSRVPTYSTSAALDSNVSPSTRSGISSSDSPSLPSSPFAFCRFW